VRRLRRRALLLFPALSFDAAPRIIVEANHAGLPVLASAHGGSPEMLDGAGFLIPVAPHYRADPATLPDSGAVTPLGRTSEAAFASINEPMR